MAKPFLLFQAPVATRSGYGEHSRDLLHSLIAMDRYDIRVISTRWGSTPMNALDYAVPSDKKIVDLLLSEQLNRQPDIFIQVTVPNEFNPIGKFNIGITAGIETTNCAPNWLEGINRMDLNIVPSNFSKEIFVKCAYGKVDTKTNRQIGELRLEKPMEVLFEGVDTTQYGKDSQGNPVQGMDEELAKVLDAIPEDYCFLFVGHWLKGDLGEDRKNVGMLVQTFFTIFQNHPKPPALVLKCNAGTFSVMDREEVLHRIRTVREKFDGNIPNVYLLHGDLSTAQMNGLYNHPKVKTHVTFTKGEGFGRPLLEASLSGKPIIATNWSGHLDFLNPTLTTLLPGELKQVHPSAADDFILREAKWFNVSMSHAAVKLNELFVKYDDHLSNARKLMLANKTTYSLDEMKLKFEEILDKYIKI